MILSTRTLRPLARALFSALLLAACDGRGTVVAQPDPGGHEHASVQVTLWESGVELFVEYDVPEAGHAVEFITHVSDLATGAPRRAGSAIFRLRSPAGAERAHTEADPDRPGIYLPELVFSEAGTWSLSIGLPGPDGTTTVELPPIQVAASHGSLHDVEVPDAPEGIGFLKEQQWRLGTQLMLLEPAPLTDRIEVPAVVRAAAENQAVVTPPISGRLEAPEGQELPHIGDMVAAGDLLGYVRPPFSEYLARVQLARSEVIRTRLAAEREEARLERTEALAASEARSERQLEEARFAFRLAQAERDASVAVARALETSGVVSDGAGDVRFELRSPIAGFVRQVSAVNGTYVELGVEVFKIRDSTIVHLDALVRPDVLDRISSTDRLLIVRARGSSGGLELSLPEAEMVFVGDELDPHTLTVPVHFEVPNPDLRLRIGERVEVQLPVREPTLELAVPVTAIVEEDGEPTVYVQLAGETFEKRHVQLGFRDGTRVQILSGLTAGERVVVEGGYAIRLASLGDSAPSHGHAH